MNSEDSTEDSYGHKKEHDGPISETPKAKLSRVGKVKGKKKQALEEMTKKAVTTYPTDKKEP